MRICFTHTAASVILAAFFLSGSMAYAADPISGDAVYARRCASCHDQNNERIPPQASLRAMPATRILSVLDFGAMMTVAYPMSRAEREAVSTWLGTSATEMPPPASAFCSDRRVTINDKATAVWNGWSPNGDNARFQTAQAAGLTLEQTRGLKLKWAFGYDGDVNAFAQPAVIGDQLFVGSARGSIYALSAKSGCIRWIYPAGGPVRTAIRVVAEGKRHVLLFGDQTGWFYAVAAESGKLLWKKKIEEHDTARLTGAPVALNGIVYAPVASWEETRSNSPDYVCCSFRGSLVALRIRDGSQVWKSYTIPEEPKDSGADARGRKRVGPSGGSVWSAPTIDVKRRRIYVTTGDNFSVPANNTSDSVLALDMATGKIVWSKQMTEGDIFPTERGPDFDFGSSAILAKTASGRELLLAGQKAGVVHALDPDKNGEIVWQVRVGKGSTNGGVQWGMAADGQNVYAAVSDLARRAGSRDLDPTVGGGLTALRIADGSKAWFAPPGDCGARPGCSPAQSAAVTAIPGAVFSGSIDGFLRAFAAEDGKKLWEFDTVRDFTTVNGVKAKGGALDGPGAVVVNGMVYVNSGYSRFGGLPGNVLLAFGTE